MIGNAYVRREEAKLETERLRENVLMLAQTMRELSKELREDSAVNQYFEQFAFQKREAVGSLARYGEHLDKIISIVQSSLNVNVNVYGELVTHLLIWLSQSKIYSGQHSPIERAALIFQLDSKMMCFDQFGESALFFKDDITSPSTRNRYNQIYQNIEQVSNQDPPTTRKEYETMKALMTITNAAVLTEIAQPNKFLGVLAFGSSYPRFLIDHKQAQLRCSAFLRQPNLTALQCIWNLPEKGVIGKLKYVQYEGIKTNQQLYIPKENTAPVDLFNPSDRSVKIRILSHQKVHFWQQKEGICSNCCSFWDEVVPQINTVVLHAHGGGFIALSSSTMESYTRRWANSLKVPVISIDYGKPPLHTFPEPVHDMLTVYRFVTEQLSKYCNINPVNIVLAGDSAGGNLMCSLMGLIIKLNLKMPKGIFLAYPACDLRKIYSPSRIHSFSDAILHPPLLLLCLKQYLGKGQSTKQSDPLATPLLLTEQYVSASKGDHRFPLKWPKTRIIVGQLDPLLDDSLRLCERLYHSGIDFKCKVFRELGHGFLSIQKVISHGEKGILHSIELLTELLR